MNVPSQKPGRMGTLQKLIEVENELLQIIRTGGTAVELSAYEAHAHVRQAIEALSKKTGSNLQDGQEK